MKEICILVNKYPNSLEPTTCVFIQQLVWTFADLDCKCSVIAPLPVNLNYKYAKMPATREEVNENGKVIDVYHPKYISFGQGGRFLQKVRVALTTFLYSKAVEKIIAKKAKNNKNLILYSHFICPSGVVAANLGKKFNLKSFMAHGEAIYSGDKKYGSKKLKKIFSNLNGVIAVSQQNKDFLVDDDVIDENKVGIFPNGYREERFYSMDKTAARKHFGWDDDKFIVGFCGSFDDRKGILRVEKACDKFDDVYFACAGKGALMPTSSKCILKKSIKNDELLYFYNAIDVFVMPTQNEGCCNAIVEAIACGCPVVSSDKSFNYDILNKNNSILVNPNNVDEIYKAIKEIKDNDKKREKMHKESIEFSKNLTLKKRAKNILNFFDKK